MTVSKFDIAQFVDVERPRVMAEAQFMYNELLKEASPEQLNVEWFFKMAYALGYKVGAGELYTTLCNKEAI